MRLQSSLRCILNGWQSKNRRSIINSLIKAVKMNPVIKRIERLIQKHETYISNMELVDMSDAPLRNQVDHIQRIEDHKEVITDLKNIKVQLEYCPV